MKKWISLFLVLLLCAGLLPAGGHADDARPLVAGYYSFAGVFSPFFYTASSDASVVSLTQIQLLDADRGNQRIMEGTEGYTARYGKTKYTYYTAADCVTGKDDDGNLTYDFTLREDLKFSDGEPVTVDDVIFSMYVRSDPTFNGINGYTETRSSAWRHTAAVRRIISKGSSGSTIRICASWRRPIPG